MHAPVRYADRMENLGAGVALLIYLAFQINAAFHHGSWGQDFPLHKLWMTEAMAGPWHFLFHIHPTRTGPPMYEWISGTVFELSGSAHWLEFVALFSIAFNAAGLWILYGLLRRLICSRLLRLACFVFVLFVPFAMITAVVFGADAMALPLFLIIVTVLLKLPPHLEDMRSFRWLLWGFICLLFFAIGNKMTFISQIPAVLFSLFVLYRVGSITTDRFVRSALTIALVCGSMLLVARDITKGAYNFQFGKMPGSEMTLRDMVFLRKNDLHLLMAPSYDERSPVKAPAIGYWPAHDYNLLTKDRFSYPGLLHLAIYTDIMNIFQYDPTDAEFGRRSEQNQKRMKWAVRTGVLFSIAFIVLTPMAAVRSLYQALVRKRVEYACLAILTICAGVWFLNVVAGFPFLMTYIGGYWLPRLIVPALVSFFVLSFCELDRLLRSRALGWSIGVLVLVIAQCALQLSFLWPWGEMKPY